MAARGGASSSLLVYSYVECVQCKMQPDTVSHNMAFRSLMSSRPAMRKLSNPCRDVIMIGQLHLVLTSRIMLTHISRSYMITYVAAR